MKQAIEKYNLELRVCGPVFVGCGYEIQKKEYLFLSQNTIGVIDPEKLYMFAKKRHLSGELEKFMVTDTKEDLKHWSVRNRIPMEELKKCMKYIENTGDLQLEKGKKQIMACVADPYGNPYIPGSPIKGMLRTILMCAELIRNPGKYEQDARQMVRSLREDNLRRNKVLQRNMENMEEKIFHTLNRTDKKKNAVNDAMSGIIISDSEPISRENMILCQKWEKHVEGSNKTINLLRECVKPGTIIKSTLTFDREICKISVEEILEDVKMFYQRYYETFQSKFPSTERASDRTVFLGGGTGFVSKTMIYSLFEGKDSVQVTKDIFEETNVPKEHKHYKDLRLGVSPHILKCTRYKGKEYMMRQCEIDIY